MADIKQYIKKVMDGTVSLEEQQQALAKVEETIRLERQKRDEAVGKNAEMVIQALKKIEERLNNKYQELLNTPAMKGEQGPQGPAGQNGKDGRDGVNGRDGVDGKDGKDGVDGKDGISVVDAKVDFDGSLVIYLSNGAEIDAGKVLSEETASQIIINSGGSGTSQAVADTLVSLQNQINTLTGIDGTLGTMAQQDDTAVDINGGTIDGTPIGSTTPNTGAFTTLTSNGATTLTNGSSSLSLRDEGGIVYQSLLVGASSGLGRVRWYTPASLRFSTNATNPISFYGGATTSADGSEQFRVATTTSAVNYVQVTGASTGGGPIISVQGSDANAELSYRTKGIFNHRFENGSGGINFIINQTAGAAVVNRLSVAGSLTNQEPVMAAVGSDTNISMALQSKGTGGVNLATGSTGVNISNGTTVTAITRTATGTGYTSPPSVAIGAPQLPSGVQATASVDCGPISQTIVSGGTGYTVNDIITVSGGTFTSAYRLTVTAVSGGVITAVSAQTFGNYTVFPSNPVSVTGGTGTGATFNLTWGINAPTITNAGSGYVEQPTVTFSGGGGSGAAAYAIVGSSPRVQTLGGAISFITPNGESFRISDNPGTTSSAYWTAFGGANAQLRAVSVNSGILATNSAVPMQFITNAAGTFSEQFRVAHATSAVNYVQVTGSATGNNTAISTQGSDASVGLNLAVKGTASTFTFLGNGGAYTIHEMHQQASSVNRFRTTATATGVSPLFNVVGSDTNIAIRMRTQGSGAFQFETGSSGNEQFRIANTASAVNYVQVTGAATGGSVIASSQGSDTNIGFQIRSKGTGDINLMTAGGNNQVVIRNNGNGTNFIALRGGNSGVAPSIAGEGGDTNIDLALTTKGTGLVRFGTYTATVSSITGYIEIKDSGGTIRRLAVVS